jgi:UDP-N-acetylmuramyl pentapeptide phosphotransferase/UDP-N-acetylglucosamine-1-phosphate transferase
MSDLSILFGPLALTAYISALASLLVVLTQAWHGKYSLDSELGAKQKMHKVPVPRVGGLAVFAGLSAAAVFQGAMDEDWKSGLPLAVAGLLVAACPVFLAGLCEDLTKSVSARTRLLAAALSGLIAAAMLNAVLPRVDIAGIDLLMQLTPVAVAITVLCVAGVTHSINIIDGFNGLACMVSVIIMAALAWLNWQLDDLLLMQLALTGMAAAIGFLVLNYPAGKLFLGDGGAYLLGFWIAQLAVLTVARNPNASAWQVLAICAYPVIEVLFSMYRRRVVRKTSSMLPDRLHFHTLFYRRVICQQIARSATQPWLRNSGVAPVLAGVVAVGALLSLAAGDATSQQVLIILFYLLSYLAAYTRLVRGHWCLRPDVVLGLRPERKLPLP